MFNRKIYIILFSSALQDSCSFFISFGKHRKHLLPVLSALQLTSSAATTIFFSTLRFKKFLFLKKHLSYWRHLHSYNTEVVAIGMNKIVHWFFLFTFDDFKAVVDNGFYQRLKSTGTAKIYRHRLIQQFFNVSFNIFQRAFFQLLLILHHLPLSSPAGNQNFIYNMQIQWLINI